MSVFDWPPDSRVATLNWEISALGGMGISFPIYGANLGVWKFRNLDNGYSVRMLLGDQSVGLRFGSRPRGLVDLAKALFGGAASSISEISLREHYTVQSAFAATELLMASLRRRTHGVTAGVSFVRDRVVLRPVIRERAIVQFDSMAFALTPALELNAWSEGEGRLYLPV